MSEMLECLVSYCSGKAHRDGMPLQYLCYRIVAGPGPGDDGGVAVITLLGAKNPGESDLYHHLHAVQSGGPRAALAAALSYLDAVHHQDDLARAQTGVQCTPCLNAAGQGEPFDEWRAPLPMPRSAALEDAITVLR